MSSDLVAWLNGVLSDEEATAREAIPEEGTGHWSHDEGSCQVGEHGEDLIVYDEGGHSPEQARHIAAHNPAAVLADVAAKRALLEEHGDKWGRSTCPTCCINPYEQQFEPVPCPTVRLLASAYRDRPGYRAEWAPEEVRTS